MKKDKSEISIILKSQDIENKSEKLIKEKWHVERDNGIRQIIASKSMELIIHGLSKTMAFHICDLHNKWLEQDNLFRSEVGRLEGKIVKDLEIKNEQHAKKVAERIFEDG